MAKKKNSCVYCYGHGIYREYAKHGWRRPMEAGPNGKPMHPREPVLQCEHCGMPEEAPAKK